MIEFIYGWGAASSIVGFLVLLWHTIAIRQELADVLREVRSLKRQLKPVESEDDADEE